MAKKNTTVKKAVKETTPEVVEEVKQDNPMKELCDSLANIVNKSKELAKDAREHAALCRKHGKHPSRYIHIANQMEAKARLYEKDVIKLRRVI